MTRRAFVLSCDPRCRQCRGTALDTIVTTDRRGRQLAVRVLCVCVEPLVMHGAEKDAPVDVMSALRKAGEVVGEVVDVAKKVSGK